MSTVSHENLVVSDSSESEEETDSPPHPPVAEIDGGISPGASHFYPSSKDISKETDVRFHISKSELLNVFLYVILIYLYEMVIVRFLSFIQQ